MADKKYTLKATNTECYFDTTNLDLAAGEHTFVVKAKADRFRDSPYSNEVSVTVEAKAQYYIRFSESAVDIINSLGVTVELDGVATDIVGATAYYCNTCRISGDSYYGATINGEYKIIGGNEYYGINEFRDITIILNGNVVVSNFWEK